jgi:hypothetical protein
VVLANMMLPRVDKRMTETSDAGMGTEKERLTESWERRETGSTRRHI